MGKELGPHCTVIGLAVKLLFKRVGGKSSCEQDLPPPVSTVRKVETNPTGARL